MANRLWNKDDIILAMWEWNETHGEPPSWKKWQYAGEGRPTSMTVRARFGSWNKAMAEAGFEPFWKQKIDPEEARKLRKAGVSDAEIAKLFGARKASVAKLIGPRPKPKPAARNRTREQRIADLRSALRKEANIGEIVVGRRTSSPGGMDVGKNER